MPTPLKPGETLEEITIYSIYEARDSDASIAALRAYGNLRGEEERAKVLEALRAACSERDIARDILRKTTAAAGEGHLFGGLTLPERMAWLSARCGYLETMLRRVLFNFPMWQEPEEQLLAAIRTALAAAPSASIEKLLAEERAKALERAATVCDALSASERGNNYGNLGNAFEECAALIRSLAAAPSGDTPGALEKLLSEGRALHDWLERKRDHLSSVGDVRGACVCAEALEEDFMRHIELRATPSGDAKGTK